MKVTPLSRALRKWPSGQACQLATRVKRAARAHPSRRYRGRREHARTLRGRDRQAARPPLTAGSCAAGRRARAARACCPACAWPPPRRAPPRSPRARAAAPAAPPPRPAARRSRRRPAPARRRHAAHARRLADTCCNDHASSNTVWQLEPVAAFGHGRRALIAP